MKQREFECNVCEFEWNKIIDITYLTAICPRCGKANNYIGSPGYRRSK